MNSNKFLFFYIFLSIPLFLSGQDTLYFSLKEAIHYTLENNIATKNAYLDKQISSTVIKEILSAGFPQINFKAIYTDNIKIKSFFSDIQTPDLSGKIDPQLISSLSEFIPALPKFNSDISLKLEQLAFDGRYFVGLKASRLVETNANTQYQIVKTQVAATITKTYYRVLLNKKLIELGKQNYWRLDTLLRQTQLMYQNGFVEKNRCR